MEVNKIYCEDVFSFLDKLETASIDLAIIDPPYNLNRDQWDVFKTVDDFMTFTTKYLDKVIDLLKPTGSLYIFNTAFNSAMILNYLHSKGMHYKNWITWYKKDGFSACRKRFCNNQETILFFTKSDKVFTFNCDDIRMPYLSDARIKAAQSKGILKNGKRWFPNPNGKLCTDVWEFPSVRLTNKKNGKTIKQKHPTPKPEGMIERMILASSNSGDLVLDLFSGTGTTAYCSKKLGRNFIACDNNKDYCKLINERINSI
ncbi:MAG: site-specific DNA-methyltransferase [Clostridia bacterium]|nr:site-specific DNA-methyltransferase [Clostridia bacterium]